MSHPREMRSLRCHWSGSMSSRVERRPHRRGIADVVQDVMLDVFAAPPRDRYQIITEHPVGQIIAEDTGLGFERTDGVVVIQIVQQGRSPEQKAAAYRE